MKIKVIDLINKHSLNKDVVDKMIKEDPFDKNKTYPLKMSLTGFQTIEDDKISDFLSDYQTFYNQLVTIQQQSKLEQEQANQYQLNKEKAMAEMLITSGFNFDGYTITKYSGYISGDDAVEVPRKEKGLWGGAISVGDALMENLSVIRRNALRELKEAAYDLGCNAVIGVDFDYLTLEPEYGSGQYTTYLPYVFGVTANGNAVVIEKNTIKEEN